MKRRMFVTLIVAALAVGAITGIAGARKPAKTKVTIEAESGGFFGYVKSSKHKCKAGRKVTLYKQKGKHQNLHNDTKIGFDIAQANNDGYMWSTGNTGSHSGKFYARAKAIDGCRADNSPTVHAQK